MTFEILTDAGAWDYYLETQNAHLLQTYAWGELKSRFGWRAERVALREGGEIQAATQILYRPLAPLLTLAYIPRGPVITQAAGLEPLLDRVKQHVRARGVFMLKLEPDCPSEGALETTLRRAGAIPNGETIQPPATIHIDLTAGHEEILKRMKPKWRYNIRLSEKKGIVVRPGDLSDFDAFHRLMQLTGERDHFAIHGADYYRSAFQLLGVRGQAQLLIAEYESKPLAMIFVTTFAREAIYLYGASSNEERNRMPNHALHWEAIRRAKERGCARYDLWGVPEDALNSEEAGNLPSSLYQFKQGFGGEVVRYTGAWDIVFNQPLYRMYRLARRIRKSSLG